MIMRRRRNVKQVIELLKDTLISLGWATSGNLAAAQNAYNQVKRALEILDAPCWETPEKWEKRTGEPWPENGAVYTRSKNKIEPWDVTLWGKHKQAISFIERMGYDPHKPLVICATEAGPPPDDWRPE
jgi:hypothetical protein